MTDRAAAAYLDAKADFARQQARHGDADLWSHVAILFDNTADEIRLGLHLKETPDDR